MKSINVAIIGVGNLAKALVEGVSFYRNNPDEKSSLAHPVIGSYKPEDINFVAAFDVDERKVGKNLNEAIAAEPNVTMKIADPLETDVVVQRGPTIDGIIDEMRDRFIKESAEPVADIVNILKETRADIVINLIPTGSHEATYAYAEAALEAGCSFVNCIPTPLGTNPNWRDRFEKKGLVLLGDDTKSQLGATMLNSALLELLKNRGLKITNVEQENRGSNTDHFNLLHRPESKEKSKREALTKSLDADDAKPKVGFYYEGEPSGHKVANLKIDGEIFGGTPISITAEIEDEISINGAGTIVDAIRITRLLLDKGMQKEAAKTCPFLMKSPPETMTTSEAFEAFNKITEQV